MMSRVFLASVASLLLLLHCKGQEDTTTGSIQGSGASAGLSPAGAGGGSSAGEAGTAGEQGGKGDGGAAGQTAGNNGTSGSGGALIGNEDLAPCTDPTATSDDRVCDFPCIEEGCPEGQSCCFVYCLRGCEVTESGICDYPYSSTGCVPAKDCSPEGTIPPPPLDFCQWVTE
jgi:hypothetical protein